MGKLRAAREMVLELRLGLIRRYTQASGKITNPMVKENSHILLVIIMKEHGSTQKLMAKELLQE